MRTTANGEVIGYDRRRLLSTAALGIAAAGFASLVPAAPGVAQGCSVLGMSGL